MASLRLSGASRATRCGPPGGVRRKYAFFSVQIGNATRLEVLGVLAKWVEEGEY